MSTRLVVTLTGLSALLAGVALAVAAITLTRDTSTPAAATGGTSTLCTDALQRRQNAETALSAQMPAGGNAHAFVISRDAAKKNLADAQNDINRYCQ